MSSEKKSRIYSAVDLLAPKNPAKLWVIIKNFMEKEENLDDFFEEIKPPVRIHKSLEECQSCSA